MEVFYVSQLSPYWLFVMGYFGFVSSEVLNYSWPGI